MTHPKTFFIALVLGIVTSLFQLNSAQAQGLFIRGDVNCDGVVDTVDLRLLKTTFVSSCLDRVDVNDDGVCCGGNDITYLENYLLFGGPPPPHPFPTCGLDTTADGLVCEFNCCCTLITQCNDGIDNDGDGFTDFPADCGCIDACDTLEANNPTQCSDGIDNDGDGLIDLADPNCVNSCDTLEACSPSTECCFFAGDVTGDGKISLPDILATVNVVIKGAPKPVPACRGDCNNTNTITLPDIIILVNHIFKGFPKPAKDVDGTCCK